MRTYLVLCIDDDQQFIDSLQSTLPGKVEPLCAGFRCEFDFVTKPQEAFDVLASAPDRGLTPAMLVSDQVMPGISGIEMIERVKGSHPEMVCVLLTGHAGLESAKYAINRHLLDQYVSKPIEDLQEFATLLANLLRGHHLGLEERQRTAQLAQTVEELRSANEKVRAMQSAAEQVAMLSKSLKALDFDEIVDIVTCEVPRLFQAEWSILCLPKNGCPSQGSHRMNCPCPEAALVEREDIADALRTGQVRCGQTVEVCRRVGAEPPDVVVPLSIVTEPGEGQSRSVEKAYLCMCRIAPAIRGELGLTNYKAELVQEILSANLTNARLYQEARRQSQIDSLTGVNTRRVLEARMEAEYERSLRYGHPFCIAVLDLDRFKRINDAHGHDAGDRVLKELAQVLRSQARRLDLVARYGGDEFVVLMPETDLDQGAVAAERMRQISKAITLPHGDPVTVSVGLAQWAGMPGDNPVDVLRRADAALYEAKRGGRDRVQVAQAA